MCRSATAARVLFSQATTALCCQLPTQGNELFNSDDCSKRYHTGVKTACHRALAAQTQLRENRNAIAIAVWRSLRAILAPGCAIVPAACGNASTSTCPSALAPVKLVLCASQVIWCRCDVCLFSRRPILHVLAAGDSQKLAVGIHAADSCSQLKPNQRNFSTTSPFRRVRCFQHRCMSTSPGHHSYNVSNAVSACSSSAACDFMGRGGIRSRLRTQSVSLHTQVVLGGSSGIGFAVCEEFLRAGAKVLSLSRRATAAEGAQHIPCDLSSHASIMAAAAAVSAVYGGKPAPISLVLNAGHHSGDSAATVTHDSLLQHLNINVLSQVRRERIMPPHHQRAAYIILLFPVRSTPRSRRFSSRFVCSVADSESSRCLQLKCCRCWRPPPASYGSAQLCLTGACEPLVTSSMALSRARWF
jgi:NAD(P)-dependent dehydrogenase (short-subunit alcohol dehydrogenase family)